MNKYTTDYLHTKGRMHDLYCGDDYLITEDDDFLLCAVFDGCSSGIDSHYASTFHRYTLREAFDKRKRLCLAEDLDSLSIDILKKVFQIIHCEYYEVNKEMLSTVVMFLLDKHSGKFSIYFCGDGCYKTGRNSFQSIHDPNGNSVFYMSTSYDFDEYLDKYVSVIHSNIEPGMTVCISTDGLESFMNIYGEDRTEMSKKLFFFTDECCSDRYKKMPLNRLYRVVTKGKCADNENEVILNNDDFTMVKIKCEANEETPLTDEGTKTD